MHGEQMFSWFSSWGHDLFRYEWNLWTSYLFLMLFLSWLWADERGAERCSGLQPRVLMMMNVEQLCCRKTSERFSRTTDARWAFIASSSSSGFYWNSNVFLTLKHRNEWNCVFVFLGTKGELQIKPQDCFSFIYFFAVSLIFNSVFCSECLSAAALQGVVWTLHYNLFQFSPLKAVLLILLFVVVDADVS